MSHRFVDLEPKYLLDEEWNVSGEIPGRRRSMSPDSEAEEFRSALRTHWKGSRGRKGKGEAEKLFDLIRKTRIRIAEAAETEVIASRGKLDYIKSEIGMNIVIPKGSIKEMRFWVTLEPQNVVAIDGFPKDVIEEKEIVGGTVKVGISTAFKFIPVVGDIIGELLEFDLNPWKFSLGSLKRVNVDFNGGLTSRPDWYFRKDGIKNDLRVALTIRKPKSVGIVEGKVSAAWSYDPSPLPLGKLRPGSDERTIKLFDERDFA